MGSPKTSKCVSEFHPFSIILPRRSDLKLVALVVFGRFSCVPIGMIAIFCLKPLRCMCLTIFLSVVVNSRAYSFNHQSGDKTIEFIVSLTEFIFFFM